MRAYLTSGAGVSPCEQYRYRLWRTWGPGHRVAFVMLNPSTADGAKDDPTIRKCVGFAEREGFHGIEIANLFAFRSTDPRGLHVAGDPYGVHADSAIQGAAALSAMVIAAWGSHVHDRPWMRERAEFVLGRLAALGPVYALKVGKRGEPSHPLMLPYQLRPVIFCHQRAA